VKKGWCLQKILKAVYSIIYPEKRVYIGCEIFRNTVYDVLDINLTSRCKIEEIMEK